MRGGGGGSSNERGKGDNGEDIRRITRRTLQHMRVHADKPRLAVTEELIMRYLLPAHSTQAPLIARFQPRKT
jgi:hypothetical protein